MGGFYDMVTGESHPQGTNETLSRQASSHHSLWSGGHQQESTEYSKEGKTEVTATGCTH